MRERVAFIPADPWEVLTAIDVRVRADISQRVIERDTVFSRSRASLAPGTAARLMDLLTWSADRSKAFPVEQYLPVFSPQVEHFGMVFDTGVWPTVRDGQGHELLARQVAVPNSWSTKMNRDFICWVYPVCGTVILTSAGNFVRDNDWLCVFCADFGRPVDYHCQSCGYPRSPWAMALVDNPGAVPPSRDWHRALYRGDKRPSPSMDRCFLVRKSALTRSGARPERH